MHLQSEVSESNRKKPIGGIFFFLFTQVVVSFFLEAPGKGSNPRRLEDIQLRWKSIDRKTNPNTFTSKCVHRVTPVFLQSQSSECLIKHILQGLFHLFFFLSWFSLSIFSIDLFLAAGRAVTAVLAVEAVNARPDILPSTAPFPVSHLFIAHGEDIYLHCVHISSPISDVPLAAYSQPHNLRVKDFCEIIDEMDMRIPKEAIPESSQWMTLPGSVITTKQGHIRTSYFPYSENQTLLFGRDQCDDLRRLVRPIQETIFASQVSDEALETAIAVRIHTLTLTFYFISL
jgi:hypothetical protein